MESKITARLGEREVFETIDGEKFYKTNAFITGQEEPVEVIISEYLLPEEEMARVELKFYLRTVQLDNGSTSYPHIISCVEVADDVPEVNSVVMYGYITNKGTLNSTSRVGQNNINLIVKYRVNGASHFVRVRAHDSTARRIYKEANASDDIHVEGWLSIQNGRFTVDVRSIIAIKETPTRKPKAASFN